MVSLVLAALLCATGQSTGRAVEVDISARTITATGSTTARSAAVRASDVVNVRDFGAKGDGTTDDTAAIQAAINYALAHGFPEIVLRGTFKVTSTITMAPTVGNSPRIRGAGPGYQQATINWSGGAGTPILRITSCIGCVVEDLSIQRIDAGAGIPSDAISVYQAAGVTSQHITLRNLKIGTQSVYPVAVNGIHVDGATNGTNSEHAFENVLINGASGYGIRFASAQNANTRITQTVITGSAAGMLVPTTVYGATLGFASNTGPDLEFPVTDDFSLDCHGIAVINGMWSENSNRLASFHGAADLIVHQGSWQIANNTNADGKVIVSDAAYQHTLILEDFSFGLVGSPPATRFIDLSGSSQSPQRVSIIRPASWGALNGGDGGSGIKMPTANYSQWSVELDLPVSVGSGQSFLWERAAHYHSSGSSDGTWGFDVTRRDKSWTRLGVASTVQTTNNTATPILTFKVPGVRRLYHMHATIAGATDTTGQDGATFTFDAMLAVSTGPYVWQNPTVSYSSKSAGASGWDVTAGINGSTFLPELRVTGATSTTIDWRANAELTRIDY